MLLPVTPYLAAPRSLGLPQGGSLLDVVIVIAILIGALYWQHRRRNSHD